MTCPSQNIKQAVLDTDVELNREVLVDSMFGRLCRFIEPQEVNGNLRKSLKELKKEDPAQDLKNPRIDGMIGRG